MPKIASTVKIGQRLEEARQKISMPVPKAMEAIGGVTIPTWYRWKNGTQEGGCRDIPSLGLLFGLTPNQLLLDEDDAEVSAFSAQDEKDLAKLTQLLREINQLTNPAGDAQRPVDVICEHVRGLLNLARNQNKPKKVNSKRSKQF